MPNLLKMICSALLVLILSPCANANFNLKFEPAKQHKSEAERIKESEIAESAVAALNDTIIMDEEVTFVFLEGDGPYYDPATRRIQIPYGFTADIVKMLKEADYDNDAEAIHESALNVLMFTMLHEAGHALIDVLKLPVIGREEDAVDGLAAMLLMEGWEEGGTEAVLISADSFGIMSDIVDTEEADYWGEHSLDVQRAYRLVCLAFGRDPDRLEGLLNDSGIPEEERAPYCIEEYAQVLDGWITLLGPHLKVAK